MNYSITYLGDSTIVTFSNGKTFIIDKNLDGWDVTSSDAYWVRFTFKTLKYCISDDGADFWYKRSALHRDGGPAASYHDGTKEWYQHGELHRDDGPAIIYADGTRYWYRHGKQIHPGQKKTK